MVNSSVWVKITRSDIPPHGWVIRWVVFQPTLVPPLYLWLVLGIAAAFTNLTGSHYVLR